MEAKQFNYDPFTLFFLERLLCFQGFFGFWAIGGLMTLWVDLILQTLVFVHPFASKHDVLWWSRGGSTQSAHKPCSRAVQPKCPRYIPKFGLLYLQFVSSILSNVYLSWISLYFQKTLAFFSPNRCIQLDCNLLFDFFT